MPKPRTWSNDDRPEHPPGSSPLSRIERVLDLPQPPEFGVRLSNGHWKFPPFAAGNSMPRSFFNIDATWLQEVARRISVSNLWTCDRP